MIDMFKKEKSGEGLIFNTQKFSIQDGPGIRTTVFMKGCPLSCKWCSNPESWKPYPEIITLDMKCMKFGKCIEACPNGAISIVEGTRRIDWDKCDNCLECARACPAGAIEQVGKYMTVDEIVKEIEKDRLFYVNSGGGVTFSGGEPLLQWEFVREVAKKCKEKGIHTALDTTGYAKWDVMEEVLQYIDLVLYDIKHMDSRIHFEGTGVFNELILDNARKTAKRVRTWLRFPVIPNYNDSSSNVESLGEFALELKVEKVSLLPYHSWGEQKYGRLGRTYGCSGLESPSEERIQELKEDVESYGLQLAVGR